MACWIYEGILLFGVAFFCAFLFSVLTRTQNALQNRHSLQFVLFLIIGIYFIWFWTRGQTLAMKTWHLRITDVHGNNISHSRAAIRYLISWVWFLPSLAAGFVFNLSVTETALLSAGWVLVWALASLLHPNRQFWHDELAGTKLIFHKPKG